MKEIENIKKLSRKWKKTTWLMIVGVILLILLLTYSFFTRRTDELNTYSNADSNDILSNGTD